jgi:catechol 2,3-dioxygenase-like lactoylglutathione lyase family enzyme
VLDGHTQELHPIMNIGQNNQSDRRNEMLTNVMYATLYATDQERTLKFLTEGLGLEKRVDYPGPEGRFLTVGAVGSPFEIIVWAGNPAPGRPTEEAEPGTVPGPVILESNDLRADFEVFSSRGVTFEESEPVDYPFGVRITAIDPDGNRISLRQQRRHGRGDG